MIAIGFYHSGMPRPAFREKDKEYGNDALTDFPFLLRGKASMKFTARERLAVKSC